MAFNYKDAELMNQSFGNLADTILRNRQMKAQEKAQGQELGLRERELADQELARQYQESPTNPENRVRSAQATVAEDAVKKLGVTQISSSWETAEGQKIDLTGTPDQIKQAAKDNPPAPTAKITSRFVTKDGVEHVISGTQEQLQKQQQALADQGGGISQGGFDSWTDPNSGQTFPVYTDRKGNAHVIREQPDGTVTTETGTKDPVTGKINVTTTRTPVPRGTPSKPAASAIPDQLAPSKNGGPPKRWRYTGSARTLAEAKKDSANWKAVQ